MSWSLSATAASKGEAKAALHGNANFSHVPGPLVTLINNAIDALPELEGSTLTVATYGHFNQGDGQGTSNFTITVSNTFVPKSE